MKTEEVEIKLEPCDCEGEEAIKEEFEEVIIQSADDSEVAGEVMLRDFVPVHVFSEKTMERVKRMEVLRKQGVTVHYCTECNYATWKRYDLVNHFRTHTKEQPFKCILCGQKFSEKGTLKKHLLTLKEGTFHCNQCP